MPMSLSQRHEPFLPGKRPISFFSAPSVWLQAVPSFLHFTGAAYGDVTLAVTHLYSFLYYGWICLCRRGFDRKIYRAKNHLELRLQLPTSSCSDGACYFALAFTLLYGAGGKAFSLLTEPPAIVNQASRELFLLGTCHPHSWLFSFSARGQLHRERYSLRAMILLQEASSLPIMAFMTQ